MDPVSALQEIYDCSYYNHIMYVPTVFDQLHSRRPAKDRQRHRVAA